MIRRTILIFVMASFTAAASAEPFHALSYEAGGGLPGIAGAGFTVNHGGFFTSAAAGGTNVNGGSAAGFTAANEGEFDSHFSLDGFGPSARNRSISIINNSNLTTSFYGDYGPPGEPNANYTELEPGPQFTLGPFVSAGASFITGPGSHVGDPLGDGSNPENSARAGVGVAPPPVLSHLAPNPTGGRSAFNGVFVGRFTIKQGATLSGGIIFSTLVAPGEFDTHELVLNGDAALFQTSGGPQSLSLRAYRINLAGPVMIANPSDAVRFDPEIPAQEPFGAADVIDLWVQVPAPGACLTMLCLAAGAIRRRR